MPVKHDQASPINDPAHWRQKAEEAHRTADQLTDPEIKRTMLEIAASYDQLAEIAEGRAIPQNGC